MAKLERTIELRGVRVHNLHGIDLDLPLHKLIVVTGVSGAGKTSLAFGTLYAEGQRRYVEGFSTYSRQFLEQLERPDADRIENIPPSVAIRAPRRRASHRTTVAVLGDLQFPLQLLFTRLGTIVCSSCGCIVAAHTPTTVRAFVESLPAARRVQIGFAMAVPAVANKGASRQRRQQLWQSLRTKGFNRLILAGETRTLDETVAAVDSRDPPVDVGEMLVVLDRIKSGQASSERLADSLEFAFSEGDGACVVLVEESADDTLPSRPVAQPLAVDGRIWNVHRFWTRPVCSSCRREFTAPEPRLFNFNTSLGACPNCRGRGIVSETAPDRRTGSRRTAVCPDCSGRRYHPSALAVRVAGLNLAEWCSQPVRAVIPVLDQVIAGLREEQHRPTMPIAASLSARLHHLDSLALGYLSPDRTIGTLSAGEIKRTLLAAALSSNLVNMLVVLEEPASGLSAGDQVRLLAALRQLRDAPNTLVMVEHDAGTIEQADWIVDLGPGAGSDGGCVVYAGPPAGIRDAPDSATAAWLFRGDPELPVEPKIRRQATGWLRLEGVRLRNLRGITVEFPLGVLCVVTGASGSGKRSLVLDALVPACTSRLPGGTLPWEAMPHLQAPRGGWDLLGTGTPIVEHIVGVEQLQQLVLVDEASIGRTPRSLVATGLGVFSQIRTLFAETNEAKVRNLAVSRFSFNASTGGGCLTCEGTGTIAVDMQFLPDVSMSCPDCHGTRYRREILEVKYRGLNLAEILAMTVREAFVFFRGQSGIQRRLKRLKDVGLEYLTLGRQTITLSNGESQRLKFAASLAGRTRAGTLYVVAEPAAGLHRADVDRLLGCFDLMLDGGNSLIVIENRREVLAAADWLIELGPGSGDLGGRIVRSGTPESFDNIRSTLRFNVSPPRPAPNR